MSSERKPFLPLNESGVADRKAVRCNRCLDGWDRCVGQGEHAGHHAAWTITTSGSAVFTTWREDDSRSRELRYGKS